MQFRPNFLDNDESLHAHILSASASKEENASVMLLILWLEYYREVIHRQRSAGCGSGPALLGLFLSVRAIMVIIWRRS